VKKTGHTSSALSRFSDASTSPRGWSSPAAAARPAGCSEPTGWFVESLATQTLIIFAIRTRRVPFFRSRHGLVLTLAAFAVVAVGVALTVSPLARQLGFTTLPWQFFTALVLFTIVYLLLVEMMKTVFHADPMHLAAAPHRTRGREHRIHR
jgi:Mg2+-importing ATPase